MLNQYLLGLDLGGTQFRITLARPKSGQIIIKKEYPSPFAVDADLSQFSHLARKKQANTYIITKIKEFLNQANIKTKQISAIGISVAGKVFSDKTFIGANMPKEFAKKIGNRYAIDLVSVLKKTFKVKIEIENDAICAGIAQSIYYAHHGIDPHKTFYITLSTGIGGGGPKRDLDEIGHMLIGDYFPKLKPRCGCGALGCLEAFASGEGIKNRAFEILKLNQNKPTIFKQFSAYEQMRTHNRYVLTEIIPKSRLEKLYQTKQTIDTKIIFALAMGKNPDPFAYYLIDSAAEYLTKAIINISRIHNIKHFGVGGSIITNNPKYLKLIQKKIDRYNHNCILSEKIKIEITPLKNYIGDYGALFLVANPKYYQQWLKTISQI